jgi:hypothetical protein
LQRPRPPRDRHFLIANWPFGAPIPRLYYDPRTVEPTSTASLHAKCIVVDDRRALVTSANFTSRGQERKRRGSAGVLVESEKISPGIVALKEVGDVTSGSACRNARAEGKRGDYLVRDQGTPPSDRNWRMSKGATWHW